MKTIIIPSLASNASDVLKAALDYDCAGYPLTFNVIMEGQWQFNRSTNKFEKCGKVGNIPIIDRVESDFFDGWLLGQISQGFVTITCGDRNYSKELHRSTARHIPISAPSVD